jgi:hypothetical protein
LQVHRDALDAVGELARDRLAVDAADLLEVGELRDLQAVDPHLPAEAPRAEGGGLPVVLDEAHVVIERLGAERAQRVQVEVLDVERARLQDHLELVELLHAVRVLAVAAVGGAARGLHERDVPRLGPERAQEGGRVVGAGADLGVVGLHDEAAALGPELLQGEDDVLEVMRRR